MNHASSPWDLLNHPYYPSNAPPWSAACGAEDDTFRVVLWNVMTGAVMTRLQHAHNG